nr:MAG TPA: hypothetical protein [Caudoviricetes sp.]
MIFQFASIGVRECKLFESTRAHEKTAGVEIHWRFSFAQMSDSHRRVDENSCGPALRVPPGKNSLRGCF